MKMHVGTQWVDKDEKIEVLNPFDGSVLDTVPKSTPTDVDKALETAEKGAKIMAAMPAFEQPIMLPTAPSASGA